MVVTRFGYWPDANTVLQLYIQSLALPPKIFFNESVKETFRAQLRGYYTATLCGCAVMPSQLSAYYKKRTSGRSGRQGSKRLKQDACGDNRAEQGAMLDDDEDHT